MVNQRLMDPELGWEGESSNISLATMAELTPVESTSPTPPEDKACEPQPDDVTEQNNQPTVPPQAGEVLAFLPADTLPGDGGKSAGRLRDRLAIMCRGCQPAGQVGELLTYGLLLVTLWAVAYLLLGID